LPPPNFGRARPDGGRVAFLAAERTTPLTDGIAAARAGAESKRFGWSASGVQLERYAAAVKGAKDLLTVRADDLVIAQAFPD
jgi:hypothetical protein